MKSKRGVVGLPLLLGVVTTLFMIGLVVFVFALAGGELESSTSTTITTGDGVDPAVQDWAMYNQKPSGNSLYEGDFDISNMSLLWDYDISVGVGDSEVNAPTVYDGVIYTTTFHNDSIFAHDLYTKELLWQVESLDGATGTGTSAMIDDTYVYVYDGGNSTQNSKLHALNKNTGAIVWSYLLDDKSDIAQPVLVGDVIYLNSGGAGTVYAIYTNGTLKWSTASVGSEWQGVSYNNNVVYVGSEDNSKLTALDADTGAELWNYTMDITWYHQPVVSEDGSVVYAHDYDPSIEAIWTANGTQKWSFAPTADCAGMVAEGHGMVFMGCYDSLFYAIDADTGTEVWNFSMGDGTFEASPVVTNNGIVFFTTYYKTGGDYIYALNVTDGSELWSQNTGLVMDFMTPAVVNNQVIFSDYGGNVYSYGDGPTPLVTTTTTSEAGNVISNTISSLSGVTTWFGIILVIVAMVVLILLTVLIIQAIKGSGLIQGGSA